MRIKPLIFLVSAALALFTQVIAQTPGAPVIAALSSSQTVTDGTNVSLSVSVNGVTPFSYQWRKDGTAIPGANSSIHSLVPARVADAGTYTVVVTNSAGTVTSGPIVLGVNAPTPPQISISSNSSSVFVGGNVSIGAFLSGAQPITVEWKLNGVVVASGTSTSYNKTNAQLTDSGAYSATATNAAGSTNSNSTTVTVIPLTAPIITSQPFDSVTDTASSFSLSVNVNSGGSTPIYQWSKDGIPILGANSSNYGKSGVVAADAGGYSVTITNALGSVTSRTATVTVRPPVAPTVSVSTNASNPIGIGANLFMDASVGGTPPFTIQWRKDGVAVSGASSFSFSSRINQAADAGVYSVFVSNALGSATSNFVRITVQGPRAPVITGHPLSQAVEQGDNFSLGVTVTGTEPLTYQWRKDGQLIASATSNSFSQFGRAAASDAAVYTVTVSNAHGSVDSDPAVLDVRPPVAPVITTPLSDRTVRDGESFSFSVQYSGSRNNTTIDWRRNGLVIPNQSGSETLTRSSATVVDAGDYVVTITNLSGSASSSGKVTILPARLPEIISHPTSASILAGNSLSLSAGVRFSGSAQFSYRWLRDGVAVAGGTGSSLFVSSQDSSMAGTYRAEVSNAAGTVTSRDAVITVDSAATRPPITSTSGSVAVDGGNQVTLQITTAAAFPVQWQRDGVNVPNANSTSLSLSNIATTSAGTYTAVVSAPTGTVTSRPIVLSILDSGLAPTLVTPLVSLVRQPGDSANFLVGVEGERPITYQWRKDGVAIPGATALSYNLTNLVAAAAGQYSVAISNRLGALVSPTASLAVQAATIPIFRTHPSSRTLEPNNGLSLNASLFNSAGVAIQWLKDGVAISGATSLSFFNSSSNLAALAGRYVVVATNAAGSASSVGAIVQIGATVAVPQFGSISQQSPSVLVGSSFVLSATFSGATSYQWRRNGAVIPGATTASLDLSNLQVADSGTYVVVGFNADGASPSTPVQLTVQTPAPGVPIVTTQPRNVSILPGNVGVIFAGIAANPGATYQWRFNGAPIAGATNATLTLNSVQASAAGRYTIVATNSFGAVTSNEAVLTLGTPITFPEVARSESRPAGTQLTLQPTVQGPGPRQFQWKKDGVAIAGATGATLSFAVLRPADSGVYTLVVTNSDGSAESPAYMLSVASSLFAGTYYGTFTPGEAFALHVSAEGTGSFVGLLVPGTEAVVGRGFVVGGDGSFTFGGAAPRTYGANRIIGDFVSGRISGGVVTGRVSGREVPFSGSIVGSGSTADIAGYYQAVPLLNLLGEVHAIVAGDGTIHLLFIDPANLRAGRGTLSSGRSFASAGPSMNFNVVVGGPGILDGGIVVPGGPAIGFVFGRVPVPGGPERLANVSARGIAGTGSRALIAGFVVSPGAPKDILVRGVGPALTGFGVAGALANPRLRLFLGTASLLDNDDWGLGGFAPQIATATTRVGGFPLSASSLDSALITRLDPGGYSAQITGATEAPGVALAEVYDATETPGTSRIINLSTRGEVGTGGDILIVGIVVTGNAAKKILLRGVGPTLGAFGVPGVLADPQLRLFRGTQQLRENDNWSSGPDAALIVEAAQSVGAFSLTNGSRDAALLFYLAPGAYSAQLSGVGNTTGIGLVEVYDVP